MEEYTKHNLQILEKIEEVNGSYQDATKLLEWKQEIWGLNQGVYQRLGLLRLPLIAEGFDESLEEHDRLRIYTVFDDKFFDSEGHTTFSDWDELGLADKAFDSYGVNTLSVMKEHIANYFIELNHINSDKGNQLRSIDNRVRKLLRGCFSNYFVNEGSTPHPNVRKIAGSHWYVGGMP
jgi:hypothetical protein